MFTQPVKQSELRETGGRNRTDSAQQVGEEQASERKNNGFDIEGLDGIISSSEDDGELSILRGSDSEFTVARTVRAKEVDAESVSDSNRN